ncbi:alpha/beta fold hydrolase [Flavobacterium quisquiliarum]|uniref:Alpha/beta fold hydrolase n=1 Tax=Flavobacterium quisquiliarum TaxID=1834436 RepID=A0ABV8W255_9FLAO|nr:alpha/beta hydrolase [Flavobacterium quisquiliarum]
MAVVTMNSSIMGQSKTNSNKSAGSSITNIHYQNTKVDGLNIFYRGAGHSGAPVILLLHGYPTSSHMFRNLIPILSEKYHVIAPDLPGFGFSDMPDRTQYSYTFDNLFKTMQGFIEQLALKRFAVYVFDYGAPVGFRLSAANPEKITGIISQNGNAYEEGFSAVWNPIQKYWNEDTLENRNALKSSFAIEGTKFQYFHGVTDHSLIAPEAYTLDQYFLNRPGAIEIQLDLLKDYKSNVAMYPKFQEYFRNCKPKFLAVWGDKDPYFLPQGAEAFKRDIPDASVTFYDTGHFALETHAVEIGKEILKFLQALPN